MGGKPPKKCGALTTIKNIVLRCILLVTISMKIKVNNAIKKRE
jgi:hypothetical protein